MKKILNKPTIIVDGDNMLYRAHFKFGGFSSTEGNSSSILFGLPYMLNHLLIKFKPRNLFVVFDGGRNSARLEVLPDYKEREKRGDFDAESFHKQKEEVQVLLRAMACEVIIKKGQEADDLIYTLTRKLKGDLLIVSSDKDFHQLLSGTISIYSPSKEVLLTQDNLIRYFPYKPSEVVDYLILDGDKSDKIPGVPGMGEKTIRKFLDGFGSIDHYFGQESKKYPKLTPELYKRNRLLIDLAYFYRRKNRKVHPIIPVKEWDPTVIKRVAFKYQITTLRKPELLDNFKKLIK